MAVVESSQASWLYLARIVAQPSAVYQDGVAAPGIFDKLGIASSQPLATRAGNYRKRFVLFVPLAAWLLRLDKAGARSVETFIRKHLREAGLYPGPRPFPLDKKSVPGPRAIETVIPDTSRSLPEIRKALREVGIDVLEEINFPDVRVWLPPSMVASERWRDILEPILSPSRET